MTGSNLDQHSDDNTGESNVIGAPPDYFIPHVFGSLNITYELVSSDVVAFTAVHTNGTWTGDLGMLQRGDVNVNTGAHYLNSEKFNDFCPLEYYQRVTMDLLASVGKIGVFDFFSFIHQVETSVWYLLILSLVCIVLSSAVADALLFDKELQFKSIKLSISRCFWIYLASLFCEGSPRTMFSRRSQLLMFIWLLSVLVLVNILYSQFKAILMARYDDSYISSVQDLAEKPHIQPLMIKNSFHEDVLRDSPQEAYRRVFANAMRTPENAFVSMADHMSPDTYQLVKDGKHILVTGDFFCMCLLGPICNFLTGNRKLYFVKETLRFNDIGFFVTWDFPKFLRNKLNNRLSWMKATGLSNHWLSLYHKDFEKCQSDTEAETKEFLKLKHLRSAFLLYLMCCGTSFIVLITKFIYKRYL